MTKSDHDHGAVARIAGLAAISLLAACTAGSGDGLDVSGRPLEEGGEVPLAATLESIQANVFNPFCVVCHAGANAPLGLRLDAGNSYSNLVGVRSRQVGSLQRVAPGDPDASYLIRKLEGTQSQGERMPLRAAPVPQATIDFVRQWISDGASPDSGQPPAGPPVVVALSPTPGSSGTTAPLEITAGFDQDIDASTVNALTFRLLRSGNDGNFSDGNEVEITATGIELSPVNARLAIMDLSGTALVADTYRIVLHGAGPNVILGISGEVLDGEFTGALPSGDGEAGGDFVAEFALAGLEPTLASIQAEIFTPSCATANCHTGPAGTTLPAGMDLSSAAASAASLIDVTSSEQPALLRVASGNADASYMIDKLEGTAASGGQMPLGGPYLTQADIDVIRLWIDNGAPQ